MFSIFLFSESTDTESKDTSSKKLMFSIFLFQGANEQGAKLYFQPSNITPINIRDILQNFRILMLIRLLAPEGPPRERGEGGGREETVRSPT